MNIILIKHCETEVKNSAKFQGPEVELSNEGEKQSQELGETLSHQDFEVVFTSSTRRALQTAQILASELQVALKVDHRLDAHRRPSEVIGRSKTDPEIVKIYKLIHSKGCEPGWRYSDEESYSDFIERSREFLISVLDQYSDKKVLIVTHGSQIKVFLGLIKTNFKLTPKRLLEYWDDLYLDYGSLSEIHQDDSKIEIKHINRNILKKNKPNRNLEIFPIKTYKANHKS